MTQKRLERMRKNVAKRRAGPGKASRDTSMDLRITGVWPGGTSVQEWFLLETTRTDEKLLNI